MSTTHDLTSENEIGKTIRVLRNNVGKSREEIALGLCSTSVLQRLEAGERFADKKLIDALIQRLGKSSDKFEFVLGKVEYETNQKRIAIDHAFEIEDYDKCRELLKKFEEECKKEDTLNWQYIEKMKFLLRDLEYKTINEAEELILKMIRRTSPGFCLEKMEERLLCTEECRLIYLLALTEIEYKCFYKAMKTLKKLSVYLEDHFSDVEERIKLYPQVAYSLAACYGYYKKYTEEVKIAEKAINLLEENGRIYLLADLLECYKNGFLGEKEQYHLDLTEEEEEKKKELENQIEVLKQIQEEYGSIIDSQKENDDEIYLGIKVNTISHNYGGQEIHLIHEVLTNKTKIKGLTQEKLSEGICEPATLSRLLNGKQMPNKNTYRTLARCLELDTERCRPYLSVEDYEVYEMRRELGLHLQRKEYDLAEEVFQKIECALPQNVAKNRQFCLVIRTIIESRLGRISWEKRLRYLEMAIICTIPDYPNISISQCSLSRQEAILLNNIANTYTRLGNVDKAMEMFEEIIKSYQNSEVDMFYYVETLTLTMLNYAEWLGNLGKYEETLQWYQRAIEMNVRLGRGKYLAALLYGKAWNMKMISISNINKCQKYCRKAYYIASLMREDRDKKFYLEYGKKNFGKFEL